MPQWLNDILTSPGPAAPPPAASVIAPPSPEPTASIPSPSTVDATAPGGPPTIAERLRFWSEWAESPEDEEDRALASDIRKRIFDSLPNIDPAALSPEQMDERYQSAMPIAREMAATKLRERARQERVVLEVMSTLDGRVGLLQPLLDRPDVAEVLVNAPNEVYIEVGGRLERADIRFRGDKEVRRLVESLATQLGEKFDYANPILKTYMRNGARLTAVRWTPSQTVALRGTAVSIRKFESMPGFEDMCRQGAIPDPNRQMRLSFNRPKDFPVGVGAREFLEWMIRTRLHFVVSGSTSAGKTTFANALMELFARCLRVVIIEDNAELLPPPDLHVVRLQARRGNIQDIGQITLADLLDVTLRLRPDIIVVGECRRRETAVMIEAMHSGHHGSTTTVHANSPFDALDRMVRMLRPDFPNTPTSEIRRYLTRAVRIIVQMSRDESGSYGGLRAIERIAAVEFDLDSKGGFLVHDLYRWTPEGYFRPTGYVPRWARPEGASDATTTDQPAGGGKTESPEEGDFE